MKILLCISRLPYAQATVAWGNLVGSLPGSEITLLTVYQAAGDLVEAAATLDAVRAQIGAPVTGAQLRRGRVIAEIVEEASHDYDLIVVGDHQAQSIWDLWRSPRPLRLARRTPTSLMVVKSARPVLRRVLISTGAHEHSRPAVEMGIALAQASGAAADVLYVRGQMPGMFSGLREMNEPVADLLQTDTPVAEHLRWAQTQLKALPAGGEILVRSGLVVETILAVAAAYDLLVLGAHESGVLLDAFLADDIVPDIIARSSGTVLVVRSKSPD